MAYVTDTPPIAIKHDYGEFLNSLQYNNQPRKAHGSIGQGFLFFNYTSQDDMQINICGQNVPAIPDVFCSSATRGVMALMKLGTRSKAYHWKLQLG